MSAPTRISHYKIFERIGRDGPTEIYRARDLRLERDVAVRLLRPEAMARPEALERFRREARIASLVTHPHICTVHDSGEESGQAFIVCELLDGKALDELLPADGGGLPLEQVIDIGLQIADALAASHRRGVVHANLKPSNVFLTTDGHVKLLELGAAGAISGDAEIISNADSRTTTVTPVPAVPADAAGEFFHPYLSPEQVAGLAADHRSDLFSTGALLYHIATGRPAFSGRTLAEVTSDISAGEPPAPRTLRPALPPVLDAAILRCLRKHPEDRYQRAGELLEDLRRARRILDVQSRPQPRWRTDRRVQAGILGALILAVAGLVGARQFWWAAEPPIT